MGSSGINKKGFNAGIQKSAENARRERNRAALNRLNKGPSFARMMRPNPNKQVKELPPQPVHEKPRKRFFGIF